MTARQPRRRRRVAARRPTSAISRPIGRRSTIVSELLERSRSAANDFAVADVRVGDPAVSAFVGVVEVVRVVGRSVVVGAYRDEQINLGKAA